MARDLNRVVQQAGEVTGWAVAHGIANLGLTGNLRGDPITLARLAMSLTYPHPR